MAITKFTEAHEEEEENVANAVKELLHSLPKERGWRTSHLYLYNGFWCQSKQIQATVSFQKHFKPKNTDLILSTIPKSGTTWLKALAFAIVNRVKCPVSDTQNHPLLSSNPHDLVPFFEYKLYANNQIPELHNLPEPRLFATHVPFSWFPTTITNSICKIVYLCRNPFDTFISSWHFLIKVRPEFLGPLTLEEAFDMYCNGVIGFGPFWEHMLGYWNKSVENPNKVMFLKYEDMKDDICSSMKKLAEFLGFPFSEEEEMDGVIEEIRKICSFEKMKELEVNKMGKFIDDFENKSLFRKGKVGDWVNYLSPLMVDKLKKVMEEKLESSGLKFKVF